MTNEFYCPTCKTGISFGFKEEINSQSRTYWGVLYCKRCGTVTNTGKEPFNYSNWIPRIGKWKTALLIQTISLPYHWITWNFGWIGDFPFGGILMTCANIALLAYALLLPKPTEVNDCSYTEFHQYTTLVHK